MKTILGGMKQLIEDVINNTVLELLDVEEKEDVNRETGEISKSISVYFEIPRGNDVFSKCQAKVKIPDGVMKIDRKELEKRDFWVKFENAVVSFINEKGVVFFKADDYEIEEDV